MDEKILEQTEKYYGRKVREFGATSKGVDWNSKESQRIRFKQLEKILCDEKRNRFSICDYGCGYGYFSEYLKEKGYLYDYTGIDLSKDMIHCAVKEYGLQENVEFYCGAEIEGIYDYIIASGVFNIRLEVDNEKWKEYMIRILEQFHRCSRKGFAFNCLTKYSDLEYMKDYLYYGDPLFYFDYSKRHFSRNVALLHDYDLYEFTLLIKKDNLYHKLL